MIILLHLICIYWDIGSNMDILLALTGLYLIYNYKEKYRVWTTTFGVKAYKEGSEYMTSTGPMGPYEAYAALPSTKARHKKIVVRYNGNTVELPVLDVGPWNIDDEYWDRNGIPKVVKDKKDIKPGLLDKYPDGAPQNAALDLTPKAWQMLGVSEDESLNYSDYTEWCFI